MLYALILFGLIFVAAFFTSSETALSYSNHIRIKTLAQEGKRSAKYAQILLKHFDTVLVTLLLCIHVVYAALASVATLFFHSLLPEKSYVSFVASLVTTIIIFLFCENIPKNIARDNSDKIATVFAFPLIPLVLLLLPISILLVGFGKLANKIFEKHKEPLITPDELSSVIEIAAEEGVLASEDEKILKSAITFEENICKNILIPIAEAELLATDLSPCEIETILLHSNRSRIPVYSGTIDNIIGVLRTDLYLYKRYKFRQSGVEVSLTECMLPPCYVRADEKISSALATLKEHGTYLAIVKENGQVVGIITTEDIVEQVVGDIYDEYEEAPSESGGAL